jgi:HD-like signal output (HDOD) protein
MGLINVTELKPGMVLAAPLADRNGRFLLGKGTTLIPKHLRILKIWGIIEAEILGVSREELEADMTAQKAPDLLEAAERVIRGRFIHADPNHPVNRELFRICTLRKADEILRSPHETDIPAVPTDIEMKGNGGSQDMLRKVSPSDLIGKDINLSTLPAIYMQIHETIRKPNSSANDIANVISKDTTLSARLLKLVNSPFYGFPSKIDTLSRAAAIVGTRQLSTLAMGINIIKAFKKIPDNLITMHCFWEHSIACGITARIIGGYKSIQNTERLFVAGLLHDIGRLILYNYSPVNARNALLKARCTGTLLREVEHEILDFDHSVLGGLLFKKWKLPLSLENIVKYHHRPQNSKDPLEPAIVHLADIITNALCVGSSGERFVPPLEDKAWECLGLSTNILALTINRIDRQIEEISKFLL